MHRNEKTMAIYFEHPEWFRPLLAEFDRRGTAYVKIDAAERATCLADGPKYARDRQFLYYNINALSNFVADAPGSRRRPRIKRRHRCAWP